MQIIASTSRGHAGARVAKISGVASITCVATIVGALVIVALLIGWIVAASLGLGAEGQSSVGPDRPPVPVLVP